MMLGAFLTLLLVKGCVGMGQAIFGRWTGDLDPASKFGVGGLLGLGTLGTLTFLLGMLPGGFTWGIWLVGLWGIAGLAYLAIHRKDYKLSIPRGPGGIALLLLIVLGLFSLVSVLAPSTMDDWDSLAYHLAVPKLWLAAGKIVFVPSMHQSNFPDVVDSLYVWGLSWGAESGAKALALGFFLLGIVAVFGLSRKRYGTSGGWWAAVAFASVPAVLWEAGTAYIDHAHGLFAGLGIAFAALALAEKDRLDKNFLWLSAFLLGFAAASKYTGLMTIFVVCLMLLGFLAFRKQVAEGLKAAVLVGLVALAVGSPWYVKNVVNTANPVYPFLSNKLGGRDWDQNRAEIYQREQKSFGVGRGAKGEDTLDPTAIGGAILGLGYQPGRFVNPGQLAGGGTPTGAVGIAVLVALALWAISGKRKRFESAILASSLLTLLIWFFLSQQSRYITTLAPPAAILLGGAVTMLPLGAIAAAIATLQGAYSLWLFQTMRFSTQIQVVTGKVTEEDYQTASIPFYAGSKAINQSVKGGKVALYDEVFGYLLDVPYMWANPGHSTIIPYDSMKSGDDYAREMKRLGFTHAYASISGVVRPDRELLGKWIASMGLNPQSAPLDESQRKAMMDNWEQKWQILFADAVASGKLQVVQQFRSGILFKFQ